MTNEELQRIGLYKDKIEAADGNATVLTEDERRDLQALLAKWLAESELAPESIVTMHGRHPIYGW